MLFLTLKRMKYFTNNKVKNIIFDLGGVIMNLDVSRTINAFKNIGITDIVNNTGHHYKNSIFYDFELGKVSERQFLEELANISTSDPSETQLRDAWNEMILNMPKERIKFLLDLKKKYKIYLLSNTNSIHQKKFLKEVNNANNISFNELFEKACYSHELGIRKPNEEVFHFVLKDSKLNNNETIFVDDSLENITSAQQTGLKTFHVKNYNLLGLKDKI